MEQVPPPIPSDDTIRDTLGHRVDACGLSPGMVVGMTQDGRHSIVAHGTAAAGKPMQADTVFEIGSVTKLFTALLLADMAHRGEAALDEPVASLLPPGTGVPGRNGKAITLLHLATHTSGLPRIPPGLPLHGPDPYAGFTPQRLYACLGRLELARTPGEGFEYSNLGAGLLGHALALRAGQEYEALVAARILAPLRMASTAIGLPPALAARFASAHDDSGDAVPAWDMGVLAGAGGLRSTAPDLLRFLDALIDTEAGPLGPAARLLAAPCAAGGLGIISRGAPAPGEKDDASSTTAKQASVAQAANAGLGFGLMQPEGHMAIQHEGQTGGFRSYVGCVPAWRRGAVVLANANTGACADLGIHLCDARWALTWHRRPAPVDPACFDRLLGRYRMRPGVLFDVTRAGDRLMVRLTGQDDVRVFPLSEWAFFYKRIGAQLTFEPGPDGRAARLILHQNSQDTMAERVEA